jgi:hypothetical protein
MKSRGLLSFATYLFLGTALSFAGWVPVSALNSPAPQDGARFGVDLLMEGNTLVAGEHSLDYGAVAGIGAMVSFERNAAGV